MRENIILCDSINKIWYYKNGRVKAVLVNVRQYQNIIDTEKRKMGNAKNHSTGRKKEKESLLFLKEFGYIVPSIEQRKEIVEYYFEKNGKIVAKTGFDIILSKEEKLIGKKDITLYEVKTANKKRGKHIGEDFMGIGFTLTGNEKNNADLLGNKYKFIFVNLYKKNYKIFNLNDFFNKEKSNIYPTWSIFYNKKVKSSKKN